MTSTPTIIVHRITHCATKLSSTTKGVIWHQLPEFHTSQGHHHNSQGNVFRENGVINESQRDNQIWSIHCDSRALFGTIATAADLNNGTGPNTSIESMHALIGANIDMDLQDVPAQLYATTQKSTG